jgi:hypothetical protein
MFGDLLEDLKRKQELYNRWAAMQGREPSWSDFMRYSGDPDADAYIASLEEEMASRPEQAGVDIPMGVSREEAAYAGLPSTGGIYNKPIDITPQAAVDKLIPKKPKEGKETDDIYSQLFLASLMEEMGGGKVGQAPGVVTGGGFGGLPSMMGQFRRQQKPWWIV